MLGQLVGRELRRLLRLLTSWKVTPEKLRPATIWAKVACWRRTALRDLKVVVAWFCIVFNFEILIIYNY